jgi:hypothetical protein
MRNVLTAVFAMATTVLVVAVFTLAPGCTQHESVPAFTIKGHQGAVYIVVVSQADSGDGSLWAIARSLSERKADPARNGTVQVMFWNELDSAPSILPMTDQQMASEIAQININPHTGLVRLIRDPFRK